ncbi:hypothetical protein J3R30DRAFT_3702998 [Lentinula aciculospora]|uniref:Uncharacterized protein n=1 Tax=Lentinula aciculospora TaxID=153920 RepID=A0A9W9DN36_9AGAR|nr:hypothetical protein J3R30DRAFT_3702998 [Lentinula aciculospora]
MSSTIPALSSMINYSHHWNTMNGTKVTNNAGATANLTFEGTFVQVFGTIPAVVNGVKEPVSSYSLDGAAPVQFNAGNFGLPSNADNHNFYQSNPGLAKGNHSLIITSETDGANFILSSIVISSNPVGVDPSPVSSSQSPPIPSSSEAPNSSTSGSSQQSPGPTFKPNIGAIVGGIIAALVVLFALVAFLLVRRRKRQRSTQRQATPFNAERNDSPLKLPSYASDSYTVSTSQPRNDEKEPLPEMSLGPTSLVRHGSMYKPRIDSDNLPPMEFGYGVGV